MDFNTWYNNRKFIGPDITLFNDLNFELKLGVFIKYCYEMGYIIIVTNLGYKVRLKDELPPRYIINHLDTFNLDDPIEFYRQAIKEIIQIEKQKPL